MNDQPTFTFRVRTKAKSDTWFDPANDHEITGFTDRPTEEEIRLGVWEESHGTGYTTREVVIPYTALPALYRHLDKVLSDTILRLESELARLEEESDEYKTALHQADREVYMEIFTRRAAGG